MRKSHYIALLAAAALIAALYWGINTRPPKKEMAAGMPAAQAGDNHQAVVAPASTDSILNAGRQALPEHALGELTALEGKAKAENSPAAKSGIYTEIAKLWQQHKQPAAAAWYYTEAAKVGSPGTELEFAL